MTVKNIYLIVVFVFSIFNCLGLVGVLPSDFWRFSLIIFVLFTLVINGYFKNDKVNFKNNRKMIFVDLSIITLWAVTLFISMLNK